MLALRVVIMYWTNKKLRCKTKGEKNVADSSKRVYTTIMLHFKKGRHYIFHVSLSFTRLFPLRSAGGAQPYNAVLI